MKIKNAYDKVKAIELEIKQHKERNVHLEMDKIKEANERLMEKQKQIMVDRDMLTKKIDSLKDELAKQDVSFFTVYLLIILCYANKNSFVI